jgi:deoxyribonuclease V
LPIDGHGKAHPLGCGVGCHIGVELDIPTIGVAKSRMVGSYSEPGEPKARVADLAYRGKIVGSVVRTRTAVQPVYVSVGNRMTLVEAVDWTLELVRRIRLPEPSHVANRIASKQSRIRRERLNTEG